MDINAVWTATGKDLQELCLVELSHIICLRTYWNKEMQREIKDEKETLISVIKKNSFNRCNKRKIKKRDFKTVYHGWLHFNIKRNKYMSVRANNGGGARKIILEHTANKDEILDKTKSLFFIDEKYAFSNLKDMDINLGNFLEEEINDEDFTSLADYIKTASLSKTRLYLLSKKKTSNQKVSDIAIECVGCESPLFVPSDSKSDFDKSSPSLRKFVFPTEASATEEQLSKVDLLVRTLIGGSIERSIQKDEFDKLFEESLKKNKEKMKS